MGGAFGEGQAACVEQGQGTMKVAQARQPPQPAPALPRHLHHSVTAKNATSADRPPAQPSMLSACGSPSTPAPMMAVMMWNEARTHPPLGEGERWGG